MESNNKLKEELNSNIVRVSAESFQFDKSTEGASLSGVALPKGQTSRNNFYYIPESVSKAAKTMEGRPMLFNHDENRVIGHVEKCKDSDEGLTYESDLDPAEEYAMRKLERGDLKNVSIQALIDPDKSSVDEDGTVNAWVEEFLELSVVTIPGFADTTAMLSESMKAKKNISNNAKKETQVDKMSEEDKQKLEELQNRMDKIEESIQKAKENSSDEGSDQGQGQGADDGSQKEGFDKLQETINNISTKVETLEQKVQALEGSGQEGNEGGQESYSGQGQSAEDPEGKKQEAIKQDPSIHSENGSGDGSSGIATTDDIKAAFRDM